MKKTKIDLRPYTQQFYKGTKHLFLIVCFSKLLTVILNLLISWLLQQITDIISGNNTGFSLGNLVVISLICVGGIYVVSLLEFFTKPKFFTTGIAQYKGYILQQLTKKNISAFSQENSSLYISALTNDISTVEQGYLTSIFAIMESLLFFLGAIGLMLWYSPLLTLIAIGLSLFPILAAILTGDKVAEAEKVVSDRNEVYTASLKDSLTGFSVIRSFKAEKQILTIFGKNIKALAKAQTKKQQKEIIVEALGTSAGVVAQIGVFLFGAFLALTGKGITAGTTIVFVQLMNFVLSPISTLPICLARRKAAKKLVQKIAEALSENVREEEEREHKTLKKGITVNHISFGYSPEKQVLHNITYSFELGKKYAIVGASGSGKSTLLNLLMASYQNYDGTIFYDDTELREFSSSNLYEIESIIQQNVFVFNATIKDNITMFRDFPEDEVKNAVRLSGLSALIEEKGTDYLCGENGCGLSGGEKQRISIARSLLKKSQVLLVDEATAALDAETAYQVMCAILGLENVTAIVVTHTLEEGLLKQYDGILTFKNGEIIEAGTFEELIAKKGYFYSLFTISQ